MGREGETIALWLSLVDTEIIPKVHHGLERGEMSCAVIDAFLPSVPQFKQVPALSLSALVQNLSGKRESWTLASSRSGQFLLDRLFGRIRI